MLERPVRPDARVPGSARRLNGEETAELVAAYEAGATVAQLAVRFELSKGTVGKRLRGAGAVIRHEVRTEERELMVRLAAEGRSLNEIGRITGRDSKTVKSAVQSHR